MVVEKLVVELSGNVAALRAALAQGNTALAQTDVAAGKAQARVAGITAASKNAAPSINAFRGSLTSLVASTIRLPGPLANVTGLLSMLAIGAGPTVAILAGLAAIAGGYELLTRRSREAAKAQDEALGRIRALGKASREGREGTLEGDIAAQKRALAELEPAYRLALANRDKLMAAYEGSTTKVDVSKIGTEAVAAYMLAADDLKRAEEELLTVRVEANNAAADKTEEYFQRVREASKKTSDAVRKDLEDQFKAMLAVAGLGARTAMAQAGLASGARVGFGFMNGQPNPRLAGTTGLGEAASSANARLLGRAQNPLAPSLALAKAEAPSAMAQAANAAVGALQRFGPAALAAAGIFEVIKGVMEPLQPVLDVVSSMLRGVGSVLGSILAPVLKVVATAFSYVIQAIGWFVEGIGRFIDAIVPDWISKVGKGLAEQGQALQENAKAARKAMEGTEDAGEAAKDLAGALSEVLRNVPEGFKATLDYLKFRAAVPIAGTSVGLPLPPGIPGGGTPPGGGVTPGGGGTVMNVAAGGIVVNGVQNVKEFLRELEQETLSLASRGGAVTFQPAYLRRPL